MGSYFSHTHNHTCCPTSGKWCKKMDDMDRLSMEYALRNNYPEFECLRALSNIRNIHIVDAFNCTILHRAVLSPCHPYLKLIQKLIDRGININATTLHHETVLHFGIHHELMCVKLLIDNGADINALNNTGMSPLCLAALCGYKPLCILLLDEGANLPKYGCADVTHSILVAYGYPFRRIKPNSLPQYLADSADAAFSRRKAAIRWWFWVHTQ
jgi:ankyrin repeat protein